MRRTCRRGIALVAIAAPVRGLDTVRPIDELAILARTVPAVLTGRRAY